MMKNHENFDEIDNMLYDAFEPYREVPDDVVELILSAPHKKYYYERLKRRTIIKRWFLTIIGLFVMTTSAAYADEISSFFAHIFSLIGANFDNSSVVEAIETKEYVQNVDMDYIILDDNYKLKVDYLMLDDINLYMVFNLRSEEGFGENAMFSFENLVIKYNNDNYIYAGDITIKEKRIPSIEGWNIISITQNEMRQLFYINTIGIPEMDSLEIKFEKIQIQGRTSNVKEKSTILDGISSFNIKIDEKFKNRDVIEFELENKEKFTGYKILKCIASDTGLDLVYRVAAYNKIEIELLYENISSYSMILGQEENRAMYVIKHFNITKYEIEEKEELTFNISKNKVVLRRKKD